VWKMCRQVGGVSGERVQMWHEEKKTYPTNNKDDIDNDIQEGLAKDHQNNEGCAKTNAGNAPADFWSAQLCAQDKRIPLVVVERGID